MGQAELGLKAEQTLLHRRRRELLEERYKRPAAGLIWSIRQPLSQKGTSQTHLRERRPRSRLPNKPWRTDCCITKLGCVKRKTKNLH